MGDRPAREAYIRALGEYAGAMMMRTTVKAAMDELVSKLSGDVAEAGEKAMAELARETEG